MGESNPRLFLEMAPQRPKIPALSQTGKRRRRIYRLFIGHRRILGRNGHIGIAHAQLQVGSVHGLEPEGALLAVTAPGNGDDLAAVGVVAGTAASEVGGVVHVAPGDVRQHDDHIGEALRILGVANHHDLAVLVVNVLAQALVINHGGVLLVVAVGEGHIHGIGRLAVRGAVLGEVEVIVLVGGLGHREALLLSKVQKARALGEQGVLIFGLRLEGEDPVLGTVRVVGGVAGVNGHPVHAGILGIVQHLVRAGGIGQNGIVHLHDLVEHQPVRPDGANGLCLTDIGVQGQVPDDGAVDPHLHQDIRFHGAIVGQRVPDVADGHGKDPAGVGLVQHFAVQGVAVDHRGLGRGLGEGGVK